MKETDFERDRGVKPDKKHKLYLTYLILLLLLYEYFTNICFFFTVNSNQPSNSTDSEPFNAWCPLKGHTHLNLQLSAAGLFKYVWPFSGHQALKGQTFFGNTFWWTFERYFLWQCLIFIVEGVNSDLFLFYRPFCFGMVFYRPKTDAALSASIDSMREIPFRMSSLRMLGKESSVKLSLSWRRSLPYRAEQISWLVSIW